MLKLMKYEMIKQKTSKIVLIALFVILEVVFLAGIFLNKEEYVGIAAGFLFFLAMITFVIVGLEEIVTYYHDLKDKSGYMLFMTPYNVYTIMGSKILTGIVSIVVAAVLFVAVGLADVAIVFAKYGEIEQFFMGIQDFIKTYYELDINAMLVISTIVQIVFGWIGMLTSAFLAITLCTTIFSGMRGKALISFVLYCVINFVYDFVVVQAANWIDISSVNVMMGYLGVLTVIFAGACYAATGYLLNKELSL